MVTVLIIPNTKATTDVYGTVKVGRTLRVGDDGKLVVDIDDDTIRVNSSGQLYVARVPGA